MSSVHPHHPKSLKMVSLSNGSVFPWQSVILWLLSVSMPVGLLIASVTESETTDLGESVMHSESLLTWGVKE